MNEVWLQLIITGGAVITSIFFTIRYSLAQTAKREKALFDHTEKTQAKMLEYFETKNGHMERVAKTFTVASNKMAKAIGNLSTQVELLKIRK